MFGSFWFILIIFLIFPHYDLGCFSKKRCKALHKDDNITATLCIETGCNNNGEFKISSCKCECKHFKYSNHFDDNKCNEIICIIFYFKGFSGWKGESKLKIGLKKVLIHYFRNLECETPLCEEDAEFCLSNSVCNTPAFATSCQNLCGLCGPSAKTRTSTTTTTTCPPLNCDNGYFSSETCACICFSSASTGECKNLNII